MTQEAKVLFQLLNAALGNGNDVSLPNAVNWEKVFDLSVQHGVPNMAYDGLQKLMDACPNETFGFDSPEREELRYKWIGYGMVAEQKYERYKHTIADLVALYSKHGFKVLLIKGYGLSLYYPNPGHRPTGDIDIFVTDKNLENAQVEADKLFQREEGLKVTKSKIGHHSHIGFKGVSVENHYEFSNTYFGGNKSKRLEAVLQTQSKMDRREVELYGSLIDLPSPTFNAIFMMWHMASHLCSSRISLRQLCDWRQFLAAEQGQVGWKYVESVYCDYGLEQFANAVMWIMGEYLGFGIGGWPVSDKDKELGSRIINDIFSTGEYTTRFSRIMRFPSFGWKFKVVHHSHWLILMIRSVILHLFHGEDIIEKEI